MADGCECILADPDAHEGKPECLAHHLESGRVCGRPEGHDGQHIACTPSQHAVATWGDA